MPDALARDSAHFHESIRTTAGIVAAPHPLAVEAGRDVLAEGGNALEAAIAAATTLAVVCPHLNHLGGDGFWLVRGPAGRVRALEASGPAAAAATIADYNARGFDAIPTRGPLAALTVPGVVGGWDLACAAARALGGRMSLPRLLERAVHHAREGAPVGAAQSALTQAKQAELENLPGFAAAFLPDGAAPAVGSLQRAPRLADTLEHLGRAGLADFYRGDVGREIAADLERIGSPLTRADLAAYAARERAPLKVALDAGTLYGVAPPTQGLAALLCLALFARLGVPRAETFAHVHGLVEAAKQALLVRDQVIADPDHLPHDFDRFLAAADLDARAGRIAMTRALPKALPWAAPADADHAVWLGAADKSGLAVSCSQSNFFAFGSGCVLPATGVLMHNRGAAFSLRPGDLRALAPGRRPFHSLAPALAVLRDGRVLAYGAGGGEAQPQTQAALFSRHVLFGVPLGAAIARPRWRLGRGEDGTQTRLHLEAGLPDEVIAGLDKAGHEVVPEGRLSNAMGAAGAVVIHPRGGLEGAHDIRAEGGAAGI